MKQRWTRLALSLAVIFGFALSVVVQPRPSLAAGEEPVGQFFTETGHTVHGEFLAFWRANGGLGIFGYPISEEFEQDGRQTQYFERAIFQAFPELRGKGYGVQLMLLGRLLTQDRRDEPPFAARAAGNGRFFSQTGQTVGGAFLNYWNRNGALAVFGMPISAEFDERNPIDSKTYRVQYFERARFEYHPEHAGTAFEVLLGQLGTQYARSRQLPPDVTERRPGPVPVGLVSLLSPIQVVVNESFISPLVERFGDVAVGKHVFVASNTILRADPGYRVCISDNTNLQDNILFLALRNAPSPAADCGERSSSTQEETSIAHQAVIRNSKIGRFTFVGFRARLDNVVLEDGAFVLHGATIRNVTIPRDRLVPIGATITTQAQADALPLKTEANSEFQREVLEVNEEFAEHYVELYEEGGFDAVTGVSAAPRTSFNNGASPTLGPNVRLEEFARIVGDVRIGANSVVGRRTSIRADEGTPITIGENAAIEDRVTFHALKGTSISIGKNLDTDDNTVFHGPLTVGDNLTIEDDAILFRATVGNRVTLRTGAIVVGVTLRDGVTVPEGAVITTQEQADALQ